MGAGGLAGGDSPGPPESELEVICPGSRRRQWQTEAKPSVASEAAGRPSRCPAASSQARQPRSQLSHRSFEGKRQAGRWLSPRPPARTRLWTLAGQVFLQHLPVPADTDAALSDRGTGVRGREAADAWRGCVQRLRALPPAAAVPCPPIGENDFQARRGRPELRTRTCEPSPSTAWASNCQPRSPGQRASGTRGH